MQLKIVFILLSNLTCTSLTMDTIPAQPANPQIPWHQSKVCWAYLKVNRKKQGCFKALEQGFYNLIKQNRLNLECTDQNQNGLAHFAALWSHPSILCLLHEHKIDCDTYNNMQQTPLHLAVRHGSIATIQTLLDYGADSSKRTGMNRTVFHCAASRQHAGPLSFLLNKAKIDGIDAHAKDDLGNTPLHLASTSGSIANVKLLLEHEADTLALNNQEQTALCLAVKENNLELICLLACAIAEQAYIMAYEKASQSAPKKTD